MSVSLAPVAKMQFIENGIPLNGGLLFTYAAGTTTKLTTYKDSTGGTPNTNPIVLDSQGMCDLWISNSVAYKFVLCPANDTDPPTNPFWTVDNVSSPTFSQAFGNITVGTINKVAITQPATGATLTIVDGKTLTANNSIGLSGVDGKTLTVNNNLTLAGTDGSTLNVGTGGTLGTAAFTPATNYAASGLATGSGLTLSASPRLMGRTTAGAGAIEEITVSGGTLAGGVLTVPSGTIFKIATLTPSAAANLDALSFVSASYNTYLIVGQGILPNADDQLIIQCAKTGPVVDTGNNYFRTQTESNTAVTASSTSALVTSDFILAAGIGGNFWCYLQNANSASQIKSISGKACWQTNATPGYKNNGFHADYTAANAVLGLRFAWSGGSNFVAQGSIVIYGLVV